MLRVVSCLAYDHNYWFVLVAAVVCVAGSVMTIRLFDRARRLTGSNGIAWVLLSGVAGGTAIWTTHFVAMLGFRPPAGIAYAPGLTLASLALAMLFTAAGLYVIARGFGTALVEAGGAIVGLGISVMHYTGMAGLEIAGRIEWDGGLATASIVFGIAFATLAANRIGGPRRCRVNCWRRACLCSPSAACISLRWERRHSFPNRLSTWFTIPAR